ncbi:PEGA domain-containing protein [Archangium gephyra]|uniref:PEGA domain-containing protein n=1 Tax=Archangium gephyra TaxID=48 RepID=UPI003B7E54D6
MTNYWADVYVDGKRMGRAPMKALSLPAGRHVVSLLGNTKVKHYRREVVIRPGETTELRVDPDSPEDSAPVKPSGRESVEPRGNEPTPPRASAPGKSKEGGEGTLRLRVKYWADVYVDGKRRGRAPIPPFSLPAGRHVIELRGNPNYKDYRAEVVIKAGESLSLTPEPKPVK